MARGLLQSHLKDSTLPSHVERKNVCQEDTFCQTFPRLTNNKHIDPLSAQLEKGHLQRTTYEFYPQRTMSERYTKAANLVRNTPLSDYCCSERPDSGVQRLQRLPFPLFFGDHGTARLSSCSFSCPLCSKTFTVDDVLAASDGKLLAANLKISLSSSSSRPLDVKPEAQEKVASESPTGKTPHTLTFYKLEKLTYGSNRRFTKPI